MNALLQWLDMGGYAWYVWPAYGIFCVFLVMNLLEIRVLQKRTRQKLTQWFKRQG